MMKKEYESPKEEFFLVEESVFCSHNGNGGLGDGGVGWEEEEEEPW